MMTTQICPMSYQHGDVQLINGNVHVMTAYMLSTLLVYCAGTSSKHMSYQIFYLSN